MYVSVPYITSTGTPIDYCSVDESRLYKIEPNRKEKPTVLRALSSPSLIKGLFSPLFVSHVIIHNVF
jgi:hypothetical protein